MSVSPVHQTINKYHVFFKKKYIRENEDEASVPRETYSNFKEWVKRQYPRGLMEEDWDAIVAAEVNCVITVDPRS